MSLQEYGIIYVLISKHGLFLDQETETFEMLDIAFIGWDLLVVQAGIPKSKTSVWNWKTSELIYAYGPQLLHPQLALR